MNMNLIALNLRPLLAILVSLVASGLIYVLGEHIKRGDNLHGFHS